MVTQQLLDAISNMLAGLWGTVPALPGGASTAFNNAIVGIHTLMHSLANLGGLIPFGLISGFFTVWLGIVGFWLAIALIKLILKVVNR